MSPATTSNGSTPEIVMGGELVGIPTFKSIESHRQWIREHMAAAFRVLARQGLIEGVAGHMSVRDPQEEHQFWMNPLGKHFAMMKASDMVLVDYDGNIIQGKKVAINAAGFHIHSAIHRAHPHVHSVCHAHGVYGRAWSAFGKPLEMLVQDSCVFYNAQSVYRTFGGVVFDQREGEQIAGALREGAKGLVLQNHGLLTVGHTVDEAASLFTLMERLCKIQLLVEAAEKSDKLERIVIADEEAKYTFDTTSTPESLFIDFQPEVEYEMFLSGGALRK
ncbi:hypothetical protein MMC08_000802 [Hypocenomyce scalaris]|nr:hypothetical protein [Hypocenomyce scalaris]